MCSARHRRRQPRPRPDGGATIIDGGSNLAAGTDPLFVGGATPTLANNGGPTQTIALQAASPLINAGRPRCRRCRSTSAVRLRPRRRRAAPTSARLKFRRRSGPDGDHVGGQRQRDVAESFAGHFGQRDVQRRGDVRDDAGGRVHAHAQRRRGGRSASRRRPTRSAA